MSYFSHLDKNLQSYGSLKTKEYSTMKREGPCSKAKIQRALWIQTLNDYPAAKISHFIILRLIIID